jgi:Flp pilus assembly protein TadB
MPPTPSSFGEREKPCVFVFLPAESLLWQSVVGEQAICEGTRKNKSTRLAVVCLALLIVHLVHLVHLIIIIFFFFYATTLYLHTVLFYYHHHQGQRNKNDVATTLSLSHKYNFGTTFLRFSLPFYS